MKSLGRSPALLDLPLLFEGFGDESQLIKREKISPENLEQQIADIFALPKVKYINIRNAEAGCFVASIQL